MRYSEFAGSFLKIIKIIFQPNLMNRQKVTEKTRTNNLLILFYYKETHSQNLVDFVKKV